MTESAISRQETLLMASRYLPNEDFNASLRNGRGRLAFSNPWVRAHKLNTVWQRKTLLVLRGNSRRGEQDLLSQLENGFEIETDSLGGNPVLRRLKDDEVLRPVSANASSVKALQQRGLIHAAKSRDPLKIVWRLNKKRTPGQYHP